MEKINIYFDQAQNAHDGLIHGVCRFLPDVLILMAKVFRLYIQMFLSYGLYVCITLETTHHRTTFQIFCNFIQKTIPEENSCKMFHISSLIAFFFLLEGQGCFFGGKRIKLHQGRTKGKAKRGFGGEAQNELKAFSCAKNVEGHKNKNDNVFQ